jgi:hypothetical protein
MPPDRARAWCSPSSGIVRAELASEVGAKLVELVERLGRGLRGGVDQVRHALLDAVVLACNATTVPANGSPKVVIWTMLGERAFLSTLVRVNGHPPTQELDYDTMVAVVNLAELFPDEAVDGRVHPGRYELQIELAGVTETHVITAR